MTASGARVQALRPPPARIRPRADGNPSVAVIHRVLDPLVRVPFVLAEVPSGLPGAPPGSTHVTAYLLGRGRDLVDPIWRWSRWRAERDFASGLVDCRLRHLDPARLPDPQREALFAFEDRLWAAHGVSDGPLDRGSAEALVEGGMVALRGGGAPAGCGTRRPRRRLPRI